MSLNFNGTYLAHADPQWTQSDGEQLPPLVIPDGQGPWAVRYIWVKHREHNNEFVANYFNKGNNATGTGLNLRKQTTHMQTAWNPHNQIFETSRDNGNLVWRVKVHNPHANSIDYVEVWRSPEIIKSLFHYIKPGEAVKVTDGVVRTAEDQKTLRNGLYEAGFEVRRWRDTGTNWPTVTPQIAMTWYRHFVKKHFAQENCIINTKYNEELNPVN
jgi:hypothetical protein